MNLSPHFTLEEMTVTTHRDIDNTPNDITILNLKHIASAMEAVRAMLGKPVIVLSGYRCPDLNNLIGGSRNSRHMLGLACDFISPQYGTPLEICKKIIASDIKYFDQLIYEKTWVHFGLAPENERPRNDVLTLVSKNTYAKGLVP